MPTINVSELEFGVLVGATIDAYRKGRHDDVKVLDKLARKINCALSHSKMRGPRG